jgi:Secretion system C-terminal sorting domain
MKTYNFINKIFLLSASLFFQIQFSNAQQATIASGGNFTGSGGNMSYSIGQIMYTTNNGINGSIAQGVQQPFEISTVLGIDETQIQLDLTAYPNPTSDYLILSSNNSDLTELSFELIDSTGKLIETRKIKNTIETIRMEDLPDANYFVKVDSNGKVIKVFKIIKN